MPVTGAPTASARLSRKARRGTAAAIGLGVAAVLSIATLSNQKRAEGLGHRIDQGIRGVETVAAMLGERSPGERPEGALANLKPKREAALHARALPKIRGTAPTAYETLAGPPPSLPVVPPVQAPLYNMVAGTPQVVVPPTAAVVTPGTPGTPGGPPILSEIPAPGGGGGGGGGGIFSPPVITATPPITPTSPPPTSAVPEPASWGLMLVGFALMGRALRHRRCAGRDPALG